MSQINNATVADTPESSLVQAPDGYEYEMRVTEVATGKYLRSRIVAIREGNVELDIYKEMLRLLQSGQTGSMGDVKAEGVK